MKPIRVVRLRRKVKSLQRALDAAWENLGALALANPSFQTYLQIELPELSLLQQQVGEKRSVADSLRCAKGSSSVLKEVEAELIVLCERQRKLMVAIGQKAEVNASSFSAGQAHFAAIARLRSTLENAERELLSQEQGRETSAEKQIGRLNVYAMSLIGIGAAVVVILVLWGGWWLLTPSLPRHIQKAVFDESKFSEPILLQLPGDDSAAFAQFKNKQKKEGMPMFFSSAVERFQGAGGKSLLNVLISNGFAKIEKVQIETFQGIRTVPCLIYRDTLKPYCVDRQTTRLGRGVRALKASEDGETPFQSSFYIAIAKRQLKSIDYKNAYQGEIPLVGVKTDFYATTFSYRLKADFPGLPKCGSVFKANAKAFYDPDTGEWKAEVKLEDDGAEEYMKLLAETAAASRLQ